MQTILKKSEGFEPLSLFTSNAELFDVAVDAYASLASTLCTNAAPTTISAEAFATDSALEEMKAGYLKMHSHFKNNHYIFRHARCVIDENDPVYWAYEILGQWLRVSAIKNAAKLELEEEETPSTPKRIKISSVKSVSLNQIEFSREFDTGEWALAEEINYMTQDYDGPSPLALELDALLVETEGKKHTIKATYACVSTAARLIGAGTDHLDSLVVSIHTMINRINADDRRVALYPSKLRLNRNHTHALRSTAAILHSACELARVLELTKHL